MGTELLQVAEHAGPEADSHTPEAAEPAAPEWPSPIAHVPATMSVGGADDAEESAADRMADSALARLSAAHPPLPDRPAATGPVRRSVVAGGGHEGGALDGDTAARIAGSRGRPMAEPVRRRMEGAFGRSFLSVRVHDGAEAADLSGSISAQAFTTGNDVFLGAGVDPGTPGGERVLAHELAHVVQNRGGRGPIHRIFGFGKKKEAPAPAPAQGAPVPDLAGQVDAEAPKPAPAAKPKAKPPLVASDEGLADDARKAFATAKRFNSIEYPAYENQVRAWVTQKQQKEITDISSYTKRAGGDVDKRSLKDLLRAFILKQYVDVINEKLDKPVVMPDFEHYRALTAEERTKVDGRYYPKTLQNRNKWKGLIDKGPYAPETQTWLESAGFARAIERTPEQKASDAGGPKLDVRATFIGGEVLGAPRRMHLFLVYTSSEGEQTYFRGGPGRGGMTVCGSGDYTPDTIDWDPAAPSVTVATGDPAVKALDKLYRAADVINAMEVPYVGSTWKANSGGLGGLEALVTGENCNATAWTLLDRAGVEKKKPSGTHPGWGHKLGAILSPDKAVRLDLRENIGDGTPGKLAGDARKVVQIYHDRGKSEKLITLPGGTDIAVVKSIGAVAQIRFGPDRKLGYVEDKDLHVPPKPGRRFWVRGNAREVVPIDGGRVVAEGGHEIFVLDDSWIPGDPGMVRVRYVDPVLGTHEGLMDAAEIDVHDPNGPPPVDDEDDDDDDF